MVQHFLPPNSHILLTPSNSWLPYLIVHTHACTHTNTYTISKSILLSLYNVTCMYDLRAELVGLENQLRGSSLGKTIFFYPTLKSLQLPTFFTYAGGPVSFPLPILACPAVVVLMFCLESHVIEFHDATSPTFLEGTISQETSNSSGSHSFPTS